MAEAKAATNNSNEDNIKILKADSCPTSSGKSNLGYQVGADKSGAIHLKVSSNDGGGMFSPEWVSFTNIQAALTEWPEGNGITSNTFRKIFRGKSAKMILAFRADPNTDRITNLLIYISYSLFFR
jgi:hypothetical protein